MTEPIKVYYWPTPNGHKVTIALEEMGLPYEIVGVNVGAGDQFSPAFLRISPSNRIPAIIDPEGPEGEPISIFESGAILQYLARKTGRFQGANPRMRAAVDEWLFWQMAGLGPISGQANHFRNHAPVMLVDQRLVAYSVIRFTTEVRRLYGVLDKRLADHEYVAHDYSIADIAIWPWIFGPRAGLVCSGEFPHVERWRAAIRARAPVGRAMKAGEHLKAASIPLRDQGAASDSARRILFGQIRR